MRNLLLGAIALAAAGAAALPASASTVDMIDFTLRGNSFPLVLRWQLPTSPTPDITDPDDENFDPDSFDLSGPFHGTASFFIGHGDVEFDGFTFYTSEQAGGFTTGGFVDFGDIFPASIGFPLFIDVVGPQLFTGDTLNPTFKPGHYSLYDNGCGCDLGAADIGPPDWQLTIGDAPEPAAWALMILGFGVAGAALRRRTVAA